MLAELVAQRFGCVLDRGRHQSILFGGEHLLELPSASRQRAQGTGGGIGQRSELRSDRLGEARQHLRIDAIGFGQLASRTGEVAHLTRIDHDHRQVATGQRCGDDHFVATRRLKHNTLWSERAQPVDERTERSGRAVGLPLFGGRADCDIERVLTDINADPGRGFRHQSVRVWRFPNPARPC